MQRYVIIVSMSGVYHCALEKFGACYSSMSIAYNFIYKLINQSDSILNFSFQDVTKHWFSTITKDTQIWIQNENI